MVRDLIIAGFVVVFLAGAWSEWFYGWIKYLPIVRK